MRELFRILMNDLSRLQPDVWYVLANFFSDTPVTTQNKTPPFALPQITTPGEENPFQHMKCADDQRAYFIYIFNEFVIKQREQQLALACKQKQALLKNSQPMIEKKAELEALFFAYLTNKTKLFVNAQGVLVHQAKQQFFKESACLHQEWDVPSNEWECVDAVEDKPNKPITAHNQ